MTRRATVAAAALVGALGLAACGSTPVEPTTESGPGGDGGPARTTLEVFSNSGSVPPPHDSQERVVIHPDLTATYFAGSRYDEDNPLYTADYELTREQYDEVLSVWDSLGIPEHTGDTDSSHSSDGDGGAYAIVYVTGGPYDAAATGDDDEMWDFVDTALDTVPDESRAEGEAAVSEYNDSEDS
ncbi:hypothetical protein CZ771_01575 [Actinomycetales bacterium JB111]|nr:hypothetical protein CZ771_01575 [Actinomycetales bacterium JB111]